MSKTIQFLQSIFPSGRAYGNFTFSLLNAFFMIVFAQQKEYSLILLCALAALYGMNEWVKEVEKT